MSIPLRANPLAEQHCVPRTTALDPATLADELTRLPGWRLDGDAIEKVFDFKDFHETMAFVNALAFIAHREDHHPDLQVGYKRCTVRYATHSAGGITLNDCICAARIDALLA